LTHDQLLDEHRLSDTSTSEQTNFTTTSVGSQQVDDLDTGNKNFGRCRLINELWRIGVNG
jgi:hypothetical protein